MTKIVLILLLAITTLDLVNANEKYEYIISTKSVSGSPIVIKQIDVKWHGEYIPSELILGEYRPSMYKITPVEGYEYLKFSPWSSYCVPIIFEFDSETNYIKNARKKSPEKGIYFIAALCRGKQFSFRYYKHENSVWKEITRLQFPKERALENLWDWMGGGIRYSMDTPKYIKDGLKESDRAFVRDRATVKPSVWMFYTGLTARLWAHLESGIDFWEFDNKLSDEEALEQAKLFAQKYSIN